jgi:hypothetical protein
MNGNREGRDVREGWAAVFKVAYGPSMTPVKLEKALIICSYTEMPLRNSRALINCKSTNISVSQS